MTSYLSQLAKLKPLLRNNLFLDLDAHLVTSTKQEGLVCDFLGMRLASVFQPVFRLNGSVHGREALLRASIVEHGELAPDSAFSQAIAANDLVNFDRLVRTLHLVNHAVAFDDQELIFLNVHPRLLTSVKDHGRVFEHILHYHSVPTSRVVIEIKESAVEDQVRLVEAVKNYRSLGYQIAVDDFGATQSSLDRILKPQRRYESLISNRGYTELDRVLALQPDIIKIDGAVIRAAERIPGAGSVIYGLVNIFHNNGAQVVIEGIENAKQLEIAHNTGADLLQGYHLGRPEFAVNKRSLLCRTERLAA